jgi:hypothetical protein
MFYFIFEELDPVYHGFPQLADKEVFPCIPICRNFEQLKAG